MGHAIFISYRRDDSEGEAGRLFDDLTREFGDDCVFMDVAGISPGVDFRQAIEDNVAGCGVLLAVVGPTWISISNPDGHRRLDDPNDFVSLEIASALKRNVPVIPVLVHEAKMPHAPELPDSIKDLSYRNSVELTHARWNSDVALLIEALKRYVTPTRGTEKDPVHATVSVQLPAPHPPSVPEAKIVRRSKTPLLAFLALCAVALIGGLAYYGIRPKPVLAPATNPALTPTPAAAPAYATLLGHWTSPVPRTGNSLQQLVITGTGKQLFLHAMGSCQPNPCDWGTQPAVFDGQTATASFTPASTQAGVTRITMVSVQPAGSNLDVVIENTYKKATGAQNNKVHLTFVPAK